MPRSGQSVAAANREIRQEALRNQLASKGLLQQAVETVNKIEALDPEEGPVFYARLKQLDTANTHRFKLINKYLGDVVRAEHSGPDGGAIPVQHQVTFIHQREGEVIEGEYEQAEDDSWV